MVVNEFNFLKNFLGKWRITRLFNNCLPLVSQELNFKIKSRYPRIATHLGSGSPAVLRTNEELTDESYKAFGDASFSLDSESDFIINYTESVNILSGDKILPTKSYKNYKFIYLAKLNKVIKKFYNDQSSELEFFLEEKLFRTDYQCGEDFYKALYQFIDNDSFRLDYQVKGPLKDYSITSYFQRDIYSANLNN
jgi:hypothetical protein